MVRLVVAFIPSLPNLSSLRNSILHDAGHISNRKIDVLLPVILFDPAVFMVIQIFLSIILRKNTQTQ